MNSCLIGLLLLQMGAPVPAPKPPQQENDADPRNQITVTDSGLVDLRLRDADVFDALELLSEQTKRNIVTCDGVRGSVSMVLRHVRFDEALNAILTANHLTYEERDGIIFVLPANGPGAAQDDADTDDQPAQLMRVFRLSYINASDAEDFVRPLLSEHCKLARTAEAEAGIEADETSAGGANTAANDVLIVIGPPEDIEIASQAIAEIDVQPVQVLVEATILRATLNEENALGIDFNTLTGIDFQLMQADAPAATSITLGSVPPAHLDDLNIAARTDFNSAIASGGFTFGIVKDRIAAFIRALEQVTDVSVMANPKILTLNKQRGEVLVGRRDGYVTTTVTETAAVQTIEYLETGTRLIFRPFVARDGHVRMEIHPEDSNGGLTAANLPFQETTEATTNILLKDGHTILIGGLFRERTTSSRSQVPLLGNVPVLGSFLGVDQDRTTREEVIILLTVHVLKNTAEEYEQFAELKQDVERIRVGGRRGLMGTGREQLAHANYQAALEAARAGEIDKAIWNVRLALHLHPRHLESIKLEESLLRERMWHADGARVRTFVHDLIRSSAGLREEGHFGRPTVPSEEEIYPPPETFIEPPAASSGAEE